MSDQPGYTQTPNALLELLPLLPDAECRVLLVIMRKTYGWRKACDVISYSQLREATGMSQQGVINGVEAAMKRGILSREPSGHNNGFCYEILPDQVVNEVDRLGKQSTKQTSQRSRPHVVNEVDNLSPQVVNEVDTQKKDLKEKKERESDRAKRAPRTPPQQANLSSLSEPVQLYKELTGQKQIAPVLADKIADVVIDMQHWRRVLTDWVGAGYSAKNIDGMLDWYLHPDKMKRDNGRQGNGNRTTKPVRSGTGHAFERAIWRKDS